MTEELALDEIQSLLESAIEARKAAYVPYSRFAVGAVVKTLDGNIYSGCNIENASYGLTNCAERTAIFKAVSEGQHRFRALAIVADTEAPCAPCGACRQVINEFNIPYIVMANIKGDFKIVTLNDILPYSFNETALLKNRTREET